MGAQLSALGGAQGPKGAQGKCEPRAQGALCVRRIEGSEVEGRRRRSWLPPVWLTALKKETDHRPLLFAIKRTSKTPRTEGLARTRMEATTFFDRRTTCRQ